MTKIDTGTQTLLADLQDGVLTLTLNRPEARNAMTSAMVQALQGQLADAELNAAVRCIVLTGSGKGFCSGGDVKGMAESGDGTIGDNTIDVAIHRQRGSQRGTAGKLYKMPKPTIAALPGAAAGAGLSLALACDLRIASDTSFFSTSYRNVGLPGDYGGTWFLTKLVGPALAKRFYFSSEKIAAQKALDLGIITDITSEEELENSTFMLARMIADAPPTAIQNMKKNINHSMHSSLEETLKIADSLSTPVIASGGISCMKDLVQLYEEGKNIVDGIIVGRALYENKIKLKDALQLLAGS